MRTLFLQAPSFDGFDGGAGSRYQARREIRSFWYPTWLAQVAAVVPGQQTDRRRCRIGSALADVLREARDYDLAVLHTSTPSFASDVRVDRGAQGGQSAAQGRLRRRQGRGRAARQSRGVAARSISSPATNSISPSRKSPKAATGAA